jgi:hypothetical protein
MRKIKRDPRLYQGFSDLPFISLADHIVAPPLTNGGRWVRRRTGLPPRIANTVANLAGIGPQQNN